MTTAKVLTSENGQMVYLPEECRIEADEVIALRLGNAVLLIPQDDSWAVLLNGMSKLKKECFPDENPAE